MIKIIPDLENYSGNFTIQCETKEETDFVAENKTAILDRFVRENFNNIGHLNVRTFQDYLEFSRLSPQEVLEEYDGHPCLEFGELEKRTVGIILQEACKGVSYTPLTMDKLQYLANDMFANRTTQAKTQVGEVFESLGCTIDIYKHTTASGVYASASYNGTKFGLLGIECVSLFLLKPKVLMEHFEYKAIANMGEGEFKSIVERYIATIRKEQEGGASV